MILKLGSREIYTNQAVIYSLPFTQLTNDGT
jgi:hypothetical protein